MILDPFFLVLDYLGTFVFAISGSIAAARRNMDVYGSIVLALVTALGGGMLRDLFLGRTPPGAFLDPWYLLIALAGAVLVFILHGPLARMHYPLRIMDAIGLGVFTVIGLSIARAQGISWLGAILLGILSGTGGGMVRDVLCRRVPLVLEREIYAVAALAGAGLQAVLLENGANSNLAAALGAVVITGLRILSVVKDWHLPRAAWQRPGAPKI